MILLWLGLHPQSSEDRAQLVRALQRLMADDPSLAVKASRDGTVLIGAPGEDQLDAAVDQLVHRFDVEAAVTTIEVAYRETLTRTATGESTYAVQSGGRGQDAHVKVRVAPGEAGSGCVFDYAVVGGAIPDHLIASIEDGICEAIDRGVVAGYPIDDVRVTVYDGSYHAVDASAAAFRIAGCLAFVEAARRANPIVLEPIMHVAVVTPSDCARRVIRGLRARGAADFQSFSEDVARTGVTTLATLVPLSHMFTYGQELSALTRRAGAYTMTFSHYAPAILSDGDGDRAADVTAPLRPRTPPLILRAAVPEPRD